MYMRSRFVQLLGVLLAWALVMLLVPTLLALPLAVGHAQLHAMSAVIVLAPALVIALRRGDRPTMASTAPIVGLAVLAIAQLVESIGGLGYGPDNDQRVNDLVAFHELGLAVMPGGLAAALAGVTTGIGVLVGRRTGRPGLAVTLSVLILVIGGFGLTKLLGF
jgi:hypothetical protein